MVAYCSVTSEVTFSRFKLTVKLFMLLLILWPSNLLTVYSPVVTLYVLHSGHYMYRPVVTICTAQWSLYVSPSGHYMYSPVVTVCTAQWSLYVPHSGHCMYRTVVTICTTSLIFNNFTFCPHSVFMCFVWIWEQTPIISLYRINWLGFITETECVYCAVLTEPSPSKAQWSICVPPF